jgi:hypothetical protein
MKLIQIKRTTYQRKEPYPYPSTNTHKTALMFLNLIIYMRVILIK